MKNVKDHVSDQANANQAVAGGPSGGPLGGRSRPSLAVASTGSAETSGGRSHGDHVHRPGREGAAGTDVSAGHPASRRGLPDAMHRGGDYEATAGLVSGVE